MKRSTDAWLILIVSLLLGLGLVMVYSASAVLAHESTGNQLHFLIRQCIAATCGGILCAVAAITPVSTMRKYRHWVYGACIVGLVLCLVPGIQYKANGAARWIGVGGVHFQPSAFAKIAVLIGVGSILAAQRDRIGDWKVVAKAMAYALPAMGLMLLQPDFGTTAITAGLVGILVFVAGARLLHFGILAIGTLAVGVPVMLAASYRLRRLTSFLDPWAVMDGDGYHIIQSWIAMHSGGMWGQGLGNSLSKLHFLPEPWTDFIGAVIAEEMGLVAIFAVLALFALFAWRGLLIASRARDPFSGWLAATLTSMICFEALFNLGVVMGVVPPKGLVLPFISYGSTQLMAHLLAVGILLSIASEARGDALTTTWGVATRSTKVLRAASRMGEPPTVPTALG